MKQKYSKLARITYSTLVLVLVLSALASLSLANTKEAQAQTLPAYRYTKTFDTTNGTANGIGVATDPSGNVYVTGYFSGTVNFAGSSGSDTQTAGAGGDDYFLTKYNNDGSYAWTKIADNPSGWVNGTGVSTDSDGNIYTTGQFGGTVNFEGNAGTDNHTAAGSSYDAYLTKYSSSGTYEWTKTFDTTSGTAYSVAAAVDSQGNIYINGGFTGTVNFEGSAGSDIQTTTSSSGDAYITKYSSSGTYDWTKIPTVSNSSALAYGDDVAVDSQGDIYTTGDFYGTVNFEGSAGTDNQTNHGGNTEGDTFLTKYNSNGTYAWTKVQYPTNSGGWSYGDNISIDSSGNVYLDGSFSGSVTFDGSGGTDTQSDSHGQGDNFITKYGSDGSYLWTRTFDTSTIGWAAVGEVAIDPNGGVYISSEFNGSVNFEGSAGTDTKSSQSGAFDGSLTKFNSDGSYDWTRIFDNSSSGSSVVPGGIAADTLGNVYLAGYFYGTIVFDGPGGSDSKTAQGSSSNSSSYLTSYATYTPLSTPTSGTQPLASTPKAADTGFGLPNTPNSLLTLAGITSAISGLLIIGTSYKRFKNRA